MNVKTFKQISKSDASTAGGKSASLGEMTKAGFPVPPGFVILASSFDKFLESTGLDAEIGTILKKINYKEISSIDRASKKIRGLIQGGKIPKDLQAAITEGFKKLKAKYVAVRSSATAEDSKTASWAGELETYLNVKEKDLFASVIKCWSSLFTPRAIFYRFEKKMQHKKVSVAVVVQKMIQSEVSGICFTVNPVTKDKSQMVIEAGFGLGEAIVGGLVTPDSYLIDARDFSILNISVSQQKFFIQRGGRGNTNKKLSANKGSLQKLGSVQIVKLAKVCKNIEKHYKYPQDIEWAYEKGKFYITQARPITTL